MAKRFNRNFVSPSAFYGDPAKVVDNDRLWDQLKFYKRREKEGCKGCDKQQTYGKHTYCSIGRRPGYKGYCHGWGPRDA